MMINHIWSILCGGASIDSETNKISIFNVLENLTVFGDPDHIESIPIIFEAVTLWERMDEKSCEGSMRICQIKPSGERSKEFMLPIDLTQSHFHRTRIKFNGMSLSGPGRYIFQIDYKEGDGDWIQACEIPVFVKFEPKVNIKGK